MLSHSTRSPFITQSRPSWFDRNRVRKYVPAAIAVVVILALAAWFTSAVIVDVLATMPGEIRAAIIIAAFLAIIVGAGLSALLFYSSRAGYDEKAQLKFHDEPPAGSARR